MDLHEAQRLMNVALQKAHASSDPDANGYVEDIMRALPRINHKLGRGGVSVVFSGPGFARAV